MKGRFMKDSGPKLKEREAHFKCPRCQEDGTQVQSLTPQSLLKNHLVNKIREDLNYRYCHTAHCPICYFSQDPNHFFEKNDLKVKASAKDSSLDVSLCYCFGLTRQNILDEIKKTGKSTALEHVKIKMKNPGCFCETSNPQGSCCLSNIEEWIKEVQEIDF
jgi:hypothetical protein